MKIDQHRTTHTATTAASTKTTNANAARPATTTQAGASVNISETSRSLSNGATSDVQAPFDAKRVDAIKSAISAGQFKVNPDAVADGILSSASQLLTGSKS